MARSADQGNGARLEHGIEIKFFLGFYSQIDLPPYAIRGIPRRSRLGEIPVNLSPMKAANKGNDAFPNHEPNSILTEAQSEVATSTTELSQVGDHTQVCRLLDVFDQFGNPIA